MNQQVEQSEIRTARTSWKPVAAGMCVLAASVLGVGLVADASDPVPHSAAITSANLSVFAGITPVRLLDTRSGVGVPAAGAFGPGQTRTVVAAGFQDIPANATSVAINVTLPRSATTASFVTVWPSGANRPSTSTSNATPGQAVPNFTVTALGKGGAINVFNETGNTHIIIDVVGYYVTMPSGGTAAALGGALLSGLGAPSNALGDNGDFYIEQVEAEMYKKANNLWGAPMLDLATEGDAPTDPGTPTGQAPSAAGGSTAPTLSLAAGTQGVPFTTQVINVGTALTWTDADTVTVNTRGTYKISYSLDAVSIPLVSGGVELRINGTKIDAHALLGINTAIDDVRLINANAGDRIELVATGLNATVGLSGSIVIELIAAT